MRFRLPGLPPSVNQMYAGKARRFKSGKFKAWEKLALLVIPKEEVPSNSLCSFRVIFVSPRWKTKVGKIRKMDVDSRVKAIMDATFKKLGVDDSLVWHQTAIKKIGPIEKTEVRIKWNKQY